MRDLPSLPFPPLYVMVKNHVERSFPFRKACASFITHNNAEAQRRRENRAYPALCPHSFTTSNQFALRLHTMLFTLFVSVGAAPVYVTLFVFRGWMAVDTNKRTASDGMYIQ
jgi:hypothetical protein